MRILGVVAALGLLGAGGWWATHSRPAPEVRVAKEPGQFRIAWDARALRKLGARPGLEIVDGGERRIVALRGGETELYYRTAAPFVDARLISIPELTSTAERDAPRIPPSASRPEPSAPPVRLPEPIPEPAPETAPPEPRVIARRTLVLPASPGAPAASLELDPAPRIVSAAPSFPGDLLTTPAMPAPAPAPATPGPRRVEPAPPPPRSGQLVWTGLLPRNASIAVDGKHSSIGAVQGELPGRPVRVRVLPAEATAEGLRVYTADAALAARGTEPASARNGWKRTEYVYDPAVARRFAVVEAPHAGNGWKRIVVRNEARPYNVLFVLWEATSEDAPASSSLRTSSSDVR